MRALLVLLLVAGAAHADPVADLPALGTVTRGRAQIIVRGEVKRGSERELVTLVDAIASDVERRFVAPREKQDPPITLCLFSDERRYREVAGTFGPIPSDWGFYLPGKRVALANLQAGIGNLRHELVHPLIGDDFPAIPAWLNEGIAALYGSSTLTRRGFSFVVNYRLRDLQRALRHDALPSLAELAASTDDDVRGDRAMTFYAYARYVLLYADRRGELDALYGELRAHPDDAAAILAHHVDERAFRAWAAKLHR